MKYILTFFFLAVSNIAFAQDINQQFKDFKFLMQAGDSIEISNAVAKMNLDQSDLSVRKKAIIYYKLADYYEKKRNNQKLAIVNYEKSLTYEPNYYVPHLALGYLYLDKANLIGLKANAEKTDLTLKNKYNADYKSILRIVIPHFEMALACDPNEQVLGSLKNIFNALKDTESTKTLDTKLALLNYNCIDFLSED